jgi:hypothetical protein
VRRNLLIARLVTSIDHSCAARLAFATLAM